MGKGIYQLYNGDCKEILSQIDTSKVRLLLTDPPYGIGYNAIKNNIPNAKDYGDIINDSELMDLSFLFGLGELQCIWGANCFPNILPHRGRWCCWDKRMSENADRMMGSPMELAWMNRTHGFDKMYRVLHGGVVNANGGDRYHPTEKPIALMKKIIRDFTNEGDWVLDCFMGSGTTGIAAVNMGRNFIGIEIDEKYFNISKKRIDNELAQSVLNFGEEKKIIKKKNEGQNSLWNTANGI